ncbi:MAG: DUF86 domain-containing protein [Flavobacteriales bacterium]|jgi:uncharacterized protein with HEPN domain
MKKPRRIRFDFYIEEMSAAAERILLYAGELSYFEFSTNSLVRDAVIRNFEILGESVKHVPFFFQKQNKHIPWSRMYALRNFIVHEYFDVDDEILFAIIQTDLRSNAVDLRKLAQRLSENPSVMQPPPRPGKSNRV